MKGEENILKQKSSPGYEGGFLLSDTPKYRIYAKSAVRTASSANFPDRLLWPLHPPGQLPLHLPGIAALAQAVTAAPARNRCTRPSSYRCTRPEPSPPASFVTSSTETMLKSPSTECFRQEAATANSMAPWEV